MTYHSDQPQINRGLLSRVAQEKVGLKSHQGFICNICQWGDEFAFFNVHHGRQGWIEDFLSNYFCSYRNKSIAPDVAKWVLFGSVAHGGERL